MKLFSIKSIDVISALTTTNTRVYHVIAFNTKLLVCIRGDVNSKLIWFSVCRVSHSSLLAGVDIRHTRLLLPCHSEYLAAENQST